MPGHANTVSVMTAPPRSAPICIPIIVTIGIIAFLRTCLLRIILWASPLEIAVSTWLLPRVSITEALVILVRLPTSRSASVTAGRIICLGVSAPLDGRTLRLTAKMYMNIKPIQNIGVEAPTREITDTAYESLDLGFRAEIMPRVSSS